MKILALDIETAPNTAYVWGLFKEFVPLERLIETGRVMCFAYQWLDTDKIHFHSEQRSHEDMILKAHEVIEEADAVLTYNGERFDLPTLNREFLKYDLAPPAPYKSIDLFKVAKKEFRFASNKMDHLAAELGLQRKVDHRGFELWVQCMNGDRKAWAEMKEYNMQDVTVLVELYHRMLPWIKSHPNIALYVDSDDPVCTNCGSDDLVRRGLQRNKTHAYHRLQCNDCGTWLRERFSETKGNRNILVQAR